MDRQEYGPQRAILACSCMHPAAVTDAQAVDGSDRRKRVAPAATEVPQPRWTSGAPAGASRSKTKVMLQRLPATLGADGVRRVLDDLGFEGRYDDVAVPTRHNSSLTRRYAFVHFRSPNDAAKCIQLCAGVLFGRPWDAGVAWSAEYAHVGFEGLDTGNAGVRRVQRRPSSTAARKTHTGRRWLADVRRL